MCIKSNSYIIMVFISQAYKHHGFSDFLLYLDVIPEGLI